MERKFTITHLVLALIIVLAAVLRFYDLGKESFWHNKVYINVSDNSQIERLGIKIGNRRILTTWAKEAEREYNRTMDFATSAIYFDKGRQTVTFKNLAQGLPVTIHYFFLAPQEKI